MRDNVIADWAVAVTYPSKYAYGSPRDSARAGRAEPDRLGTAPASAELRRGKQAPHPTIGVRIRSVGAALVAGPRKTSVQPAGARLPPAFSEETGGSRGERFGTAQAPRPTCGVRTLFVGVALAAGLGRAIVRSALVAGPSGSQRMLHLPCAYAPSDKSRDGARLRRAPARQASTAPTVPGWLWCALVFVLIADSTAVGADADEPTKLPAFEVRDSRVGAYGAGGATSATRVSVPIQDLAQSVSVVTRELIDDTQGLRLVDVARFATPVIQNLHGAGDWYSIRGFRTSFRFIDDVQVDAQGNRPFANLSNLERLEIVKDPNTILVPGTDAGGRINQITKSPQFERFTRLRLHARSHLGNEVSLDANRVLDGGSSAVRLVATYWNGDGYFHRQFRRGWLVAPSFAHRFSDRTELIVKLEVLETEESSLVGVGIDPAVGTRTGGYARKHPLLPRDNQ